MQICLFAAAEKVEKNMTKWINLNTKCLYLGKIKINAIKKN